MPHQSLESQEVKHWKTLPQRNKTIFTVRCLQTNMQVNQHNNETRIPDKRQYLDGFEESIYLKLANEEIVKF